MELDAHDNEDQGVSEVQCVENYDQFDSIDDTVSCYNKNDHCEDDILEQIEEGKTLCTLQKMRMICLNLGT